jgi:arylsulfatase A-like enzyme
MRRLPVVPVLLALLLLAPADAAEPRSAIWDFFVATERAGVPPDAKLAMRGAHGQTRSVLQMPLGAELALDVEIPAGAVLSLGYTLQAAAFMVETHGLAEPGRVEIAFREAGADPAVPPRKLAERTIDLRSRTEDRRWFDERIDLAALAGKRGALIFRTENLGDPQKGRGTTALWSAARILAPATVEPNLLLITVDCLRADHVGAYGYDRPTTPRLDRLAASGVRFANAFANAPMTLPSIPQLFTSRLFPTKEDPIVASPITRAGIANAAVVNNAWIPLWLMQGGHAVPPGAFDAMFSGSFPAAKITDLALDWLAAHPDDRFFLYLHYLDAHTPYSPPVEHVRRFADPDYDGDVGDTFADPEGADQGRYDEADRRKIVALYDAAIRSVDEQIGRLLDELERTGRLTNTVVVVTADHGEELWEHGRFFHGQSLYDELLHVPLIVHLPQGRSAGTVVRRPVSLLSVAPSLVEWAGLERPPSFEGETLEAAIAARDAPGSDLFATATQPQFPTRFAIRRGGDKLVESIDTGRRELYELDDDPGEKRDLGAARPEAAARLARNLDAIREVLRKHGFQVRIAGGPDADRTVLVELESAPRSGTFLSVDRREAAGEPRLQVSADGASLRFEARATAAPTGFRFDRLRSPANISGKDFVKLKVTVDGTTLPPEQVAIGAAGRPPTGDVDLLDAAVVSEATPSCTAPPDGVRVCLWRVPGEKLEALPEITDPKVREKLRSLGYLQ